jgi:hypothetical protein
LAAVDCCQLCCNLRLCTKRNISDIIVVHDVFGNFISRAIQLEKKDITVIEILIWALI